jgi:hypothetical protein
MCINEHIQNQLDLPVVGAIPWKVNFDCRRTDPI